MCILLTVWTQHCASEHSHILTCICNGKHAVEPRYHKGEQCCSARKLRSTKHSRVQAAIFISFIIADTVIWIIKIKWQTRSVCPNLFAFDLSTVFHISMTPQSNKISVCNQSSKMQLHVVVAPSDVTWQNKLVNPAFSLYSLFSISWLAHIFS